MKRLALALVALVLAGCAVNRPEFVERTTGTNGVVNERRLVVSTWAFWPASQSLAAQRASLGKTFSLGTTDAAQDGGSTNVTETLNALTRLLQSLKP